MMYELACASRDILHPPFYPSPRLDLPVSGQAGFGSHFDLPVSGQAGFGSRFDLPVSRQVGFGSHFDLPVSRQVVLSPRFWGCLPSIKWVILLFRVNSFLKITVGGHNG
jgi:hypothetical protein